MVAATSGTSVHPGGARIGAAPPGARPANDRLLAPADVLSRIGSELDGTTRPLLVYLHVPFCSSKCHFCDWVSDIPTPLLRSGPAVRSTYAEALVDQIRYYGPLLTGMGYKPQLVYWGGGTPSRLDSEDVRAVVAALRESFDLGDVVEHSSEASPDSLTAQKCAALRELGVDRISLGVQSFDDGELRRSGRSHSAEQAAAALRGIEAAGIENYNIDLIVGLPEQPRDVLVESTERTIALAPPHVTLYVYRPVPGTVMAHQIQTGARRRLTFDHLWGAYEAAKTRLEAAGYEEYVLGYFSREPRFRCRTEQWYFEFHGDFVGFGAGAASMLGHHLLSNPRAGIHSFNDDPLRFARCDRFAPDRLDDFGTELRLALLTTDGVSRERFADVFGFPLDALKRNQVFLDYIEYFRRCGADIVEDEWGIRVTPETRRRAHVMSYTMSLLYREATSEEQA